jgi:hypothetical protein
MRLPLLGSQRGSKAASAVRPPGVKDVHIHFHLMTEGKNGFLAPAIFTPEVVRQFHTKWDGFGRDGDTPMPPCMGYRIFAEENSFDMGAKERL